MVSGARTVSGAAVSQGQFVLLTALRSIDRLKPLDR